MTEPLTAKPEPLSKKQLKWLRTADECGVIDWSHPKFVTYPAWKALMERLEKRGYVTERAGGGYNLTPLGVRATAPTPPPPPPTPLDNTPREPAAQRRAPSPKRRRPPRVPKLTPAAMNKLVADLPKRIAAMETDAEDRRCLRGKYTPATGICRVCTRKVIAEIAFPDTGRFGGPLPAAYVIGYHCEGCNLCYHALPPRVR